MGIKYLKEKQFQIGDKEVNPSEMEVMWNIQKWIFVILRSRSCCLRYLLSSGSIQNLFFVEKENIFLTMKNKVVCIRLSCYN